MTTALERVKAAGVYDPSDYPKMTMIRYEDLKLLIVALADAALETYPFVLAGLPPDERTGLAEAITALTTEVTP